MDFNWSELQKNYRPPVLQGAPQQAQKKKKGFLEDNISTGGSIAGALGGAAAGTAILPGVGTILGGLIGGALGGGGGQVAENAITGEQDLMKDVGSEALWGGATALPLGSVLKLGKAGMTVAKGLGSEASRVAAKELVNQAAIKTMPAKTLSEALARGTLSDSMQAAAKTVASAPTLMQKLGSKLSNTADDMAIKQFRLAPSQTYGLKPVLGQDVGSYIRKNGFSTVDDITAKGIAPMQAEYDKIISSLSGVSKDSVKQGFDAAIKTLKDSPMLDKQALAARLQQQSDAITSKLGDTVSGDDLLRLRREFDAGVKRNAFGSAEQNVNKEAADALRTMLHSVADTASVKSSTGMTLKDVGLELNKLQTLKKAAASKEGLGRGSLPLNLLSLLGASAGAGAGGLPGAIGTMMLTNAANSAGGRKIISSGIDKLSSSLANAGKKDIGQTLKEASIRVGGVGILKNVPGDQSPSELNMIPDTTATTTINAPAMNPDNMPSQYSQPQEMSNPFGYTSTQIGQGLMKAYAAGDTQAVKQLQGMYDIVSNYEQSQAKASKGLSLNSTAAGVVADTQTGLRALDELQGSIGQSGVNAPFIGQLRGMNPFDTEAQNLQAQIATAKQIVGKALEGGVLRKEDEFKYAKILPKLGDSDAVAQFKIGQLKSLISSRLNDYLTGLGSGSGGVDATDLASALGGQ